MLQSQDDKQSVDRAPHLHPRHRRANAGRPPSVVSYLRRVSLEPDSRRPCDSSRPSLGLPSGITAGWHRLPFLSHFRVSAVPGPRAGAGGARLGLKGPSGRGPTGSNVLPSCGPLRSLITSLLRSPFILRSVREEVL